jgi:4-amino-4-deoxy-L-arabinose transferase-like glycosyltransferase
MKKYSHFPFYLFCIGAFLLIISRDIFAHTQFMDGIIYAAISKNIAIGNGSFWDLHFSNTLMDHFHEHPPLAMGLESLFFKVFGDGRLIEKFYSLFTYLIVGILIWKIWKQLGFKSKLGWTPIFFWIIVPVVFWACKNNLLENTLVVFTTLSIFFLFKSQKEKTITYLFLSGLMLSLGFLSKGFVAFFPLSFLFFSWLFQRESSFFKMTLNTVLLIFFSVFPIVLICLISVEAKESLDAYFQIQVIKSLETVKTVESRFFIVKRLFSELLLPIIIGFIFYFISFKRRNEFKINTENKKLVFTLIATALAGVLPIMISMKQSGFYILATYPLFALAIAIFLSKHIENITDRIIENSNRFNSLKIISSLIFILGIGFSMYFSTKYGKDETKVKDIYKILPYIPKNSTLKICPELDDDWALHAYFQRFKNISLDSDPTKTHSLLLVNSIICKSYIIPSGFQQIKLETKEYKLFRKEDFEILN